MISQDVAEKAKDNLTQALTHLLAQASANPQFASDEHFVLFQLGNQKSLLKVDTHSAPYRFWFCDLLGRSATDPVKKTVACFLWEQFNPNNRATWQSLTVAAQDQFVADMEKNGYFNEPLLKQNREVFYKSGGDVGAATSRFTDRYHDIESVKDYLRTASKHVVFDAPAKTTEEKAGRMPRWLRLFQVKKPAEPSFTPSAMEPKKPS